MSLICTKTSGKFVQTSKFHFVDLAGSERIFKTGSTELKATEAKMINLSLSTLGRCIQALKKKEKIIPYRDSALTFLMKNSLVGNCRNSLIITVADHPEMMAESISSMRFGMECGQIKKKAAT